MNRFAPHASLVSALFAVALSGAGCGGFTSIGDGAGTGNAAGKGMGEAGDSATGGTTGSMTGGAGGKGGSGAKGGTGGGMTTGGTGGGMTTGGTGGTGMGGYEPCADKTCGATCTLCDPLDRSCVEDKAIKYCDVNGGCGLNYPICPSTGCTDNSGCVVPAICQLCPDGTSACPTAECVMGECVTSYPTCGATECMTDGDCPVSKAPCQMCADGTTACPWARCEAGKCAAGVDSCDPSTPPCKGKACGDPCTTCDPAAGVGCIAVAMYCDENLECQVNTPMCGTPQCKSDDDCATDICGMCSDGSCASQACVGGKCTFSCPPPTMDPCGGCKSGEICVQQIGGPATSITPGYHCDAYKPCPSVDTCLCVDGEGTCKSAGDTAKPYCLCDNGVR